ncbi:MAG TPA: DUF58 domain-containing protein [Dokdonella sp.]
MAAKIAELRLRLTAAAERRLPALTRLRRAEPPPIRLDRRRIYVLPTRFGLVFAVLLFVMLLGALNYGNNPALLLTCLLGAAAGASLFFGFRVLSGLVLTALHAGETYAGEPLALRLRFAGDARARPSLRVRRERTEAAFALPARADADASLSIADVRRGWFRPGRIRVWTDYPLGLFQLWSWLHPDATFLVYPELESPPPPLPAGRGREGDRSGAGDDEERAGLREYRPSDPARLIAWKPSVRHDALLVRDVERRSGEALTFDYAALSGLDHEARIRRLAAWVVLAEAERRAYALGLPGATLGPDLGAPHRHACLRALALLPHEADGAHT